MVIFSVTFSADDDHSLLLNSISLNSSNYDIYAVLKIDGVSGSGTGIQSTTNSVHG